MGRKTRSISIPAQLAIQLENADATYRPGVALYGAVRINARTDLRPRNVTLHAFGDEITTLGPNVLMTEHTHPFDLSFQLWSPSIDQDKLPKGEHSFPFEFVLPPILPPTFSGEFTHIAYRIEVKVDLPLQADLRCEQPFIVRVPPLSDVDKPLRASTSTADGLRLELDLKSSGGYPGDHMSGDLHAIGLGHRSIKGARIDLISREKGAAREFVDHFEKMRVRMEIDPAALNSGQPFPIELPIPDDVDPSFVSQHSSKLRLVRAQIDLADGQSLTTEAVIRIGAR